LLGQLELQHLLGQNHVAGAGNGQPLGDALDDAVDDGLQNFKNILHWYPPPESQPYYITFFGKEKPTAAPDSTLRADFFLRKAESLCPYNAGPGKNLALQPIKFRFATSRPAKPRAGHCRLPAKLL